MTPITFSGCTGWLHEPPPDRRSKRGVVLCAPLGNEACNAYRPLLALAEMLAAEGLPTLRFDYPGTGDSTLEDEAGPEEWTQSIIAAAAWLRRHGGVEEVALCGLRAGALLAARAASRVEHLVALALLAPVVTGRALVREMVITARTWDAMWMVEMPTEADGWFEANGCRMSVAAKQALEGLDLRRLEVCGAARALLMEPGEAPATRALADRLTALGTAVERRPFPGYEALMADALENEIPRAAFGDVSTWLAVGAEPAVAPAHPPSAAHLELGGAIETVVRFGPADALVGVLCRPADRLPRLAVLMVNTGGHPHTGHSRLSVTFARRLAGMGIASLRMDVSGTGDADLATGTTTDAYGSRVRDDARTGLRWLAARCGTGVAVLGLCSGAHVALHLAPEPELRGLVLVNLQKFLWRDGIALKVVQRATKRPTEFYKRGLRSLATWRRMLRGEVDILGISRTLAGRTARRLRATAEPLFAAVGRPGPHGIVHGWFRDLARRKVPVAYALSFNDPGLDELEEYFGVGGAGLRRLGNVGVHRLENADHTLTHRQAREELFAIITELLDTVAEPRAAEPCPERRAA